MAVTSWSVRQFRLDTRFGLFAGAVLSALIVALQLLAGALNVIVAGRGKPLLIPWPVWRALWLVAPATALLAALLASMVGFLFRPLRTGVFGWCLNGIAVAVSGYAVVGAALYLCHDPVGAYFLFGASRAEAWALFPTVSFVVLVTGAAIGTYIGMRQHTGSPVL